MSDYTKDRKLTLSYAKKHKIHTLSKSPLVVQIDGDNYTIGQLSRAFTETAADYIIAETRRTK
jgi:hypothetical protein